MEKSSVPEPKFTPLTNVKKQLNVKEIPSVQFIDHLYSKEFLKKYFN